MKVSNQRSYNWRGSNWLLFVFSICLGVPPAISCQPEDV